VALGLVTLGSLVATDRNQKGNNTSTSSTLRVQRNPLSASDPQLFAVVASSQSGASWLLSQLQQQQQQTICAPTLAHVLDPVLTDERRHSCTYAFLRDGVQELTSYTATTATASETTSTSSSSSTPPRRCASDYKLLDDPLAEHLPLLCRWIEQLQGDYSDEAVLNLWLRAYQQDDANLLTESPQCRCPSSASSWSSSSSSSSASIKGVKVEAEWLPRWPVEPWNPRELNLNVTKISGGKIIYLHRSNFLARFRKGLRSKLQYNGSKNSHHNQVGFISTEDMLGEFPWMEHFDATGLAWVQEHSSQVLMVDYDECRGNVTHCLENVWQFLGVSTSSSSSSTSTIPLLGSLLNMYKKQHTSYADDSHGVLDGVVNRDEVEEALLANGFGDFLDAKEHLEERYHEVQLWIYERDPTVSRTRQFSGVHSVLFGQEGEPSKFSAALRLLRDMPPDRLIIIGDGDRDVVTNNLYAPLAAFRRFFANLTHEHPSAIVVSAAPKCCVNALTNVEFDVGLFAPDGGRRNDQHSCNSDDPITCPWKGEVQAQPWQSFQQNLAAQRGHADTLHPFLDAGLLAGRASDLARVLEIADIKENEDATAVLTGLMHRRPDLLFLDYEQKLFGRYRESPVAVSAAASSSDVSVFTSMVEPLLLQKSQPVGNSVGALTQQTSNDLKYPAWGDDGIPIRPILDHIQRVADATGKLSGVDHSFSPEVPYFIDDDGLWVSNLIRSRTSESTMKWRTLKIEENINTGIQLLKEDENAPTRWKALTRALQSGGFPFFAFFGDFKDCNYQNYENTDSIPMFTESATVGCNYAFPNPTYAHVYDSRTDRYRGMFREYESKYPFESKIRKVAWRGTLSDNDSEHIYESIRWRVCETIHGLQRSDLFDVGLTKIPKHNHRAESNLTAVGGLAELIPMQDFMKYVAIMDMDGNSWSSRFGTLLCYNSVVVKVEPSYVDYFHYDLKPWTHYVPVKDDLSDLLENVAWIMDPGNEAVVKDIIASANQWCASRFNPNQLATDRVDIWESYVRRLDRANPMWSEDWKHKKAEMLFNSDLDIVRL